jgi:hypothetical protein
VNGSLLPARRIDSHLRLVGECGRTPPAFSFRFGPAIDWSHRGASPIRWGRRQANSHKNEGAGEGDRYQQQHPSVFGRGGKSAATGEARSAIGWAGLRTQALEAHAGLQATGLAPANAARRARCSSAAPPPCADVPGSSSLARSRASRLAAPRKETPIYPPQRQTRPSPVSGDGDQVLMNETPPFRGILSATRFPMR